MIICYHFLNLNDIDFHSLVDSVEFENTNGEDIGEESEITSKSPFPSSTFLVNLPVVYPRMKIFSAQAC